MSHSNRRGEVVALGDEAPDVVKTIVEVVEVYMPDTYEHMGEAEQDLINRLQALECITCGKDPGETAEVLVASPGIVGIWCSGQCLTDMHVIGWLQETQGDISTSIEFRGGAGGN
jgi:hypothetical protein